MSFTSRFPLAPTSTHSSISARIVGLLSFLILIGTLWVPYLISLLIVLVGARIIASLAFCPRYFEVTQRCLRIVWLTRTEEIPHSAICAMKRMPVREFSSRFGKNLVLSIQHLSGLFGHFKSKNGWLRLYASQAEDVVLIEILEQCPLVITPAEADRFLKYLSHATKQAEHNALS